MSEDAAPRRPDGIAFAGRRFRVRLETMPHPLGGVRQFEIVEAPAAAAIVPVLMGEAHSEPVVLLVEQERPPIGGRMIEIPAGLVRAQPLEEPEETAARELREETGYAAGRLHHLTSMYSSPGITNEIIHIYLATDLTSSTPAPGPEDPTEIAAVRRLPLREAVRMAARGEFRDAKTAIGLLLAGALLLSAAPRPSQTADAGGGTAMPVDPISMPFIPPEVRGAASEAGGDPGALSLENILTQEFGYANVTAYQAMEDRARIFGLYLTLVGVLAAALGAISQFWTGADKGYLLPAAIFVLLLASGLGTVFFTTLIRLRQAWRGSALAMNRIKEYYIERLKRNVPDIDKAFLWRLETLPKGEKAGSSTFLVCYTIAFVSSLFFATAIFLAGASKAIHDWIRNSIQSLFQWQSQPSAEILAYALVTFLALLIFLILLRAHTWYYRQQLSDKKEERAIQKQEEVLRGGASR